MSGASRGTFTLPVPLGGGEVRFERTADRWSFFDTAEVDRATLRVDWQLPGQPSRESRCRLRRAGLQVSGVAVDAQPVRMQCEGAGSGLALEARPGATRTERVGRFEAGAQVLEVRSVHRIQGSPLPLDEPAGYLLLDRGRPVAAVDLLDSRPAVRLATGDPSLRDAAVQAALWLALTWEPGR